LRVAATKAVFAGNRASGLITLDVAARAGASRCAHLHEAGCLRVRFPNSEGGHLEGVILNTAGGIAGGDQLTLKASVGEGAHLTLTTAAAEKAYRSLDSVATIDVKLSVAPGGSLHWLPQEMILFDRSDVRRSIEIDIADQGSIVIAEAIVFGRSAMGETVEAGAFLDRWRVRRAGRLAFAESVRLEGAIADKLAQRAVAAGGQAVATVLVVPGDDDVVASVRALRDGCRGEVGASAWNGIAVMRLCASDAVHLRHDLAHVLSNLGGVRLPRLWLN
jgi:urease accessory protein